MLWYGISVNVWYSIMIQYPIVWCLWWWCMLCSGVVGSIMWCCVYCHVLWVWFMLYVLWGSHMSYMLYWHVTALGGHMPHQCAGTHSETFMLPFMSDYSFICCAILGCVHVTLCHALSCRLLWCSALGPFYGVCYTCCDAITCHVPPYLLCSHAHRLLLYTMYWVDVHLYVCTGVCTLSIICVWIIHYIGSE